ncbi:E3 ubiquitin-protein ligase Praja-2 [Batrachochytrium dendrobatidis]|nr:E3 ubiquitin-protein ligase Praja-2 [Batrachochytrium dendrobatidis]
MNTQPLYWCHSCQRNMQPNLDDLTPQCSNCHSEFVEEITSDSNTQEMQDMSNPFVSIFSFGNTSHAASNETARDTQPANIMSALIDQLGLNPQGFQSATFTTSFPRASSHHPDATRSTSNSEATSTLFTQTIPINELFTNPALFGAPSQSDQSASDATSNFGTSHQAHVRAVEELFRSNIHGNPSDQSHSQPHAQSSRVFFGTIPEAMRADVPGRTPLEQDMFLRMAQQIAHITGQLHSQAPGAQNGPIPIVSDRIFVDIFGMGGDSGDYLNSQQSFEEFISRMMEQHAQSHHPPAASNDIIKNLPHKPFDKATFPEDECCVCQEGYKHDEITIELPCKHVFHPLCITSWLKLNGTCPVCRYSLVDNSDSFPTGDRSASHPEAPTSSTATTAQNDNRAAPGTTTNTVPAMDTAVNTTNVATGSAAAETGMSTANTIFAALSELATNLVGGSTRQHRLFPRPTGNSGNSGNTTTNADHSESSAETNTVPYTWDDSLD